MQQNMNIVVAAVMDIELRKVESPAALCIKINVEVYLKNAFKLHVFKINSIQFAVSFASRQAAARDEKPLQMRRNNHKMKTVSMV